DADNNGLIVNEAYMTWAISDEWSARFGRGSVTMADGTVVSSNDWEQVSKAFDGVMVSYDHEVARLNFFTVRGADSGTNDYGNFMGLSADFKSLPEFLKTAHLHYIMVKADDGMGPGSAEDTSRIGLTVA